MFSTRVALLDLLLLQLSKNAAYVLKILKYSFWNIYLKYVRDDVMSTFIKAYDIEVLKVHLCCFSFCF